VHRSAFALGAIVLALVGCGGSPAIGTRVLRGRLQLAGARTVESIQAVTLMAPGRAPQVFRASPQTDGAWAITIPRGNTLRVEAIAGGRVIGVVTFTETRVGRRVRSHFRLGTRRTRGARLDGDIDLGTITDNGAMFSASMNPAAQEDFDEDGQTDDVDADSDGDSIPDEMDTDLDNDGTPDDVANMDPDGDALPSSVDGDDDGDGIADSLDADDDNDGVTDAMETDTDGDGVPNAMDMDIDGDGIPNEMDVDRTGDGDVDTMGDMDMDGVPDATDTDADGDGITNDMDMDLDNDGIPNDIDTDDNNDGMPDPG
jgi:hypothetical protein